MHPARLSAWVSGAVSRPTRLGAYRIAKIALPQERLSDLYNRQRMSLAAIAAKCLGVQQSVLALQISRIESELGKQQLVRAERGHPMKLTQVGQRVVSAIAKAQPDDTGS
jgi:hypothetical protein